MECERNALLGTKMFFSNKELQHRGIEQCRLKKNAMDVYSFFYDIMSEGLKNCPLLHEQHICMDIYKYPQDGIVVNLYADPPSDEWEMDPEIELECTLSVHIIERSQLHYAFADFEDFLQLCFRLRGSIDMNGSLYYGKEMYYLELGEWKGCFRSVIEEYGDLSLYTPSEMAHHFKEICSGNVLKKMYGYFSKETV